MSAIRTGRFAIITKDGRTYTATVDGVDFTDQIPAPTRATAYRSGQVLEEVETKAGGTQWRRADMSTVVSVPTVGAADTETPEVDSDLEDFRRFVLNSYSLKPQGLIMDNLPWRYLVRSVLRGKNILMTGPAGCGKTLAGRGVADALDRELFVIPLGSTQDPRATLIGNTQYDPEKGTVFGESYFVKAIQTPNAIIQLDEISRASQDAWNILMSVLDPDMRMLRLDEAPDSPTIHVAEGVSFVATANIGVEYTSTRVLDRALLDRFVIIEMRVLNAAEENDLLNYMFPDVDKKDIQALADLADATRAHVRDDLGKLSDIVSTRMSVATAGLLHDGFTLPEALEAAVIPFYPEDGGVDSERTYIRQLIQKSDSDEAALNSDVF